MSVVLALDTSGASLSTAVAEVLDDGGGEFAIGRVIYSADYDNGGNHAETLPQLVQQSLRDAGCGANWQKEVKAILVGEGPGSFTGLRIGFSFVKGLAQGLDIPLFRGDTFLGAAVGAVIRDIDSGQVSSNRVGVSQSPDAVPLLRATDSQNNSEVVNGSGDFRSGETRVLVVRDARRQEVFAATFRCRSNQLEVEAPLAISSLSEVQNLLHRITSKDTAPSLGVGGLATGTVNSLWCLVADEDLRLEIPAEEELLGVLSVASFADVALGMLTHRHGKVIGSGESLAEVQPRYLRAMAALTLEQRHAARNL